MAFVGYNHGCYPLVKYTAPFKLCKTRVIYLCVCVSVFTYKHKNAEQNKSIKEIEE